MNDKIDYMQIARAKLINIKMIHTAIWVFFNVVIFYLSYAIISNKIDKWVWICVSVILMEGVVLILFKGICPLTLLARKYSDSVKHNFDIYLPNWLAKYNKILYSVFFAIVILLLIYRLIPTNT